MPFDENDEKDEIIIQTGGEMSTGTKWAIGLGVPFAIIIGVFLYLYNMDHIKELQEKCVELIRMDLKMQMRLCSTYDLKISKMKNIWSISGWKKPSHHNHDFSQLFILNKIEKNYFFDKLNGEWNRGVSFKTIFEDKIIQKMLQNKKITKESIIKYIVFDIFFSSINDVIIDEILNDLKKNGLKDAKPKKNQKDKALKEAGAEASTEPGEAGTEAGTEAQVSDKNKKKMKDLNKKIKLKTLQRIGGRLKALMDKKYTNESIAASGEKKKEEMKEISQPNDKVTVGKILDIIDDELDFFLGGEKNRPKTPTDEEKEQQEKYDDMKNTLKELASKGAKIVATRGLNSWWKGKEGALSFNQNIINTIFTSKNGELPGDIPKEMYKDMEEEAKITVSKTKKESIKKAFDIQDKICKQLENVSQKMEKLEIQKIMENFSKENIEADKPCNEDCQEKMYKNIFSSCDASLNVIDEKIIVEEEPSAKVTDMCKEIAFLKPLKDGFNSSLKYSEKNNLTKTNETIQDSKQVVCIKIFEAIIADVLKPLQEAVKKKFEEQTKTCKAQIEKDNKEGGKGAEGGGMDGGAVIGEGTFGCVFRPHIKCKKTKKKNNYVTKLMFESNKAIIERELKLTEKIKKIPNYQDYFAPIEEICDANMSKFSEQDKKDCKLINKKTENKYIKKIANIRFIEGDDLIDTLKKNINHKYSFVYFLTMYEQILDSLQLLASKKIVHFDIKANNMIYNIKKNKTIIFDFGLSFDIGNIINLEDIFYVEWAPEWTLWPVEVHYLGFIISKKRKMLDYELELFAKEYTNKHSVFRKLNNLISSVFIKSYKDKIIKILNFYNNKQESMNNIISYIINSTWKTWDNYSLNVMFFRFLNVINIIGYSNNEFYQELVKLFNNNISPIPSERNSIKETKQKFINIKKLLTPKILKNVSKNINNNKDIIYKTLDNDSRKRISNY